MRGRRCGHAHHGSHPGDSFYRWGRYATASQSPIETPLPEQPQEALHRLREQLIVQGENLDTVVEATLAHHDSDLRSPTADTLSFAEGRTAMQIKINLPQNLVTGLFTLRAIDRRQHHGKR